MRPPTQLFAFKTPRPGNVKPNSTPLKAAAGLPGCDDYAGKTMPMMLAVESALLQRGSAAEASWPDGRDRLQNQALSVGSDGRRMATDGAANAGVDVSPYRRSTGKVPPPLRHQTLAKHAPGLPPLWQIAHTSQVVAILRRFPVFLGARFWEAAAVWLEPENRIIKTMAGARSLAAHAEEAICRLA